MPVRTPLTIGVLGTGQASRKEIAACLSDYIAGRKARFVLPVTTGHFSDAVRTAAEYAQRNDHAIEVITDDTTESLGDVEGLLDEATKTHKVRAVPRKLVGLIEAAGDKGALMIAWDDEDNAASSALDLALDRDMTPLDLTQGLEPLKFEEETQSATAEDEDLDEPVTEPTKLAAVAEPEVVEAPEDEDEDEAVAGPEADADEAQAEVMGVGTKTLVFGAAGLLEALLVELRRIVREEISEATKPRPRGRPRKDGKPAGAR